MYTTIKDNMRVRGRRAMMPIIESCSDVVFDFSELGESLKDIEEKLARGRCYYCNPDNYSERYNRDGFDMQLAVKVADWSVLNMLYSTETHRFGMSAVGDDEAVMDIDFCPKCGRDLRGENKI